MSVADWTDDIAQYLEDQGIGVYSPGTGEVCNIFIHRMQDTPTTCICVYEYSGREPLYAHDGSQTMRPGLQIMARSGGNDPIAAYHTAQALLKKVQGAIDLKSNIQIGSHHYLMIRAMGHCSPLGWDNGVIKISQNYITEWRA